LATAAGQPEKNAAPEKPGDARGSTLAERRARSDNLDDSVLNLISPEPARAADDPGY